jgi:Mn-containing catalase
MNNPLENLDIERMHRSQWRKRIEELKAEFRRTSIPGPPPYPDRAQPDQVRRTHQRFPKSS